MKIKMELNKQQKAAAEYSGDSRNLLVVAGAGCGKTRTIIARVAHLVKSGKNPARILMLTFTNRAAKEMKERLKNDIGSSAYSIQAGTFHAFCLKTMHRMPAKFQISTSNIIDSDDQLSLMKIVLNKIIPKNKKELKKRIPTCKIILNYYSYSRNTCLDFNDYLNKMVSCVDENDITIIADIIKEYKNAKQKRNYLDYDDLLEIFANSLEKDVSLKNTVCSFFDEVLVDEMQDTNPLQFKILKHFSDAGIRLFCVGDPAQSIYKFRGAEFKHIYKFKKNLPESQQLKLSLNYRSTQEILDFANWLMDNSMYDYSNKLEAARKKLGEKTNIVDFRNKYEESRWIVEQIKNEQLENHRKFGDFMILVRTGFNAKNIEAELIQNEIPYRFIGGLSFAKSAHIRDVISLIRTAKRRYDELAWMRFLQLWESIGPAKAGKVIDVLFNANDQSPLEILNDFFGTLNPLVDAYAKCAENVDDVSECVSNAVEALMPVLEKKYEKWQYRKKDLELLCNVACNYKSVNHLIEAFTLDPISNSELKDKQEKDKVTLITVHSAKGTEAPICYIAQAGYGAFPHFKSCGDLELEEEERRILYVAITRAKDKLVVTRTVNDFETFSTNRTPAVGEDYFLEVLPDDFVEYMEESFFSDSPEYGF